VDISLSLLPLTFLGLTLLSVVLVNSIHEIFEYSLRWEGGMNEENVSIFFWGK
jgi:hypothetical protein